MHLNMSANTTVLMSLTTEMIPALYISYELIEHIRRICYYVLYPFIGVIGISGNIINIVILTRQGFRKCSNIIILSLAVSDCLFLIGVNNGPIQVYVEYIRYRFSETLNFVCFAWFMIFTCAKDMGLLTSVIIPVQITGERILAIFYPFQAYVILTPRRTVIVLSFLYVIVGICCLYIVLLNYQLTHYVNNGVVVGLIESTEMRVTHGRSGVTQLFNQIINYMTCVVIGLRIVQITNRRRQLTSIQVTASTKHGVTKTTKTLLKICLLYTVFYGSAFIVSYLLHSEILEGKDYIQWIIQRFYDVLLSLNCVGNFLIYFNARHRFRKSIIVGQRKK